MSGDERDILDVLKFELSFLERGYSRSIRTPWKPTHIFQDSLTCPNCNDLQRPHFCNECMLYHLVPIRYLREEIPCHFIPLNKDGETVYSMERQYCQAELEEAVKNWLRITIQQLEGDRAEQAA